MGFLTRPKVFNSDGIYLSGKNMEFLRYGIWLPLMSLDKEQVKYIGEYLERYYPNYWEEEGKNYFL